MRRHLALCLLVALPACRAVAAPVKAADTKPHRSDPGTVSQIELQEDLQRYTGDFISRLNDAGQPLLRSPDADLRDTVLRRLLSYHSSALDIATGPRPEINLLDMAVFVALSRAIFARHWIVELGEESRPLLQALAQSDRQLGGLLSKVLAPAEQARLRSLIDRWLADNPDRVEIEAIRFEEFSRAAAQAAGERSNQARGIFQSMDRVSSAADDAVLLADRMRFLVMRLPFLLRLQARLGVSDVTSDLTNRLEDAEGKLAKLNATRPLVQDLTQLSIESREVVREARAALADLEAFRAKLPEHQTVDATVDSVERMTDKSLVLLDRLSHVLNQVEALVPADPAGAATAAEKRVDGLMRKAAFYLALVGVVFSLVFWGGYAAAKIVIRNRNAPPASSTRKFFHLKPRT